MIHTSWCVRMQEKYLWMRRMRTNVHKCAGNVVHTYTRDAERTQGIHEWACASWSWASPLGGLHSPWLRVWVNASECVWMRKNASASECNVRQNAPYVWMHTNAFKCNWSRMQRIVNARECVKMQVRQNATCRQNAPYVWRHINAFKCNSCRMQRIVNAQ